MDEFDIYIGGIADDRVEPPDARIKRAFGLSDVRAYEFVASLPRVVKRHVPADQAERYAHLLREIGAEFELRRSPIRPAQTIGVAGPPGLRGEEAPDAHGSVMALPDLRHSDPPRTLFQATVVAPAAAAAPQALAASWNPAAAPTLRESRPAPPPKPQNQQTLREAALPDLFALPYASPPRSERPERPPPERPRIEPAPEWSPPEWPPERPRSERPAPEWPPSERPRSEPPPAAQPEPAVRPAPQASPQVWGSIEPVVAPVRPPQSRVDGFGQPSWLAVGADKYAAELEHMSSHPPLEEEEPASERPPARDPRLQARPKGPAPFAVYSTGRVVHPTTPPADEARPEPPFVLRLGLRLMLGGSLFLLLTSVRHCHLMPTDVEDALAQWNAPASGVASGVAALGPIALDWLESDLHQVTNGDKDRARGIAERLKAAGAVEVYVGQIMNAGSIQLAGELLVELPQDEAKRKAVLEEHAELMSGDFSGIAIAPQDAEGSVLRVTF